MLTSETFFLYKMCGSKIPCGWIKSSFTAKCFKRSKNSFNVGCGLLEWKIFLTGNVNKNLWLKNYNDINLCHARIISFPWTFKDQEWNPVYPKIKVYIASSLEQCNTFLGAMRSPLDMQNIIGTLKFCLFFAKLTAMK